MRKKVEQKDYKMVSGLIVLEEIKVVKCVFNDFFDTAYSTEV